jgi:ribose 5-phosphate isomerase B
VVQRALVGDRSGRLPQPVGSDSESRSNPKADEPQGNHPEPVVALGADHGGFALKQALAAYLQEQGYKTIDCGTHSTQSVDYPDFAFAVARLVSQKQAWRGIVIDGAGIGSCMVANKVPGVRAAMCYDQATAINSREHNNANVLSLGAKMISENQARQIANIWLTTLFGGDRHARRLDKMMAIEEMYLKNKD